jgi:VIT1/CCC1 family predicted Fe2+/Mn2+ transporter
MSLPAQSKGRVLDPIERVSEMMFGLLMAMTFIGSISVASDGREEARTMMIAALGCNLAWGLTDAVMYVVGLLTERRRAHTLLAGQDRAAEAEPPGLRAEDLKGALAVFLVVVLATFPVVLPFLFFSQLGPALHASRAVAVAMLFVGGCALARYSGGSAWRTGFAMAMVGAVLVAAIMALGG